MEEEQRKYQVTFYLSDGKEICDIATSVENKKACLKTLEELIINQKMICLNKAGVVIRTKYITHVKVIEIKNENK